VADQHEGDDSLLRERGDLLGGRVAATMDRLAKNLLLEMRGAIEVTRINGACQLERATPDESVVR
jgi:hypothetical protein